MTPSQTKRRLGMLSLVVSAGLVAVKFYAYHLTRSQAVLTDALESIINVFTSGFALYSLHLASLPKDENHPYGHGKVENLSLGFEGALIFIAGAFILYNASLGLLHPHPVARPDWGVALLASTAVVNLGVGLVLVRSGKRLKSVALVGDGQHLYIDALTSIVSSAALVLVAATGQVRFDSGAALLLGGFILVNGGRMLRHSVSGLMDETDTAIVAEVIDEPADPAPRPLDRRAQPARAALRRQPAHRLPHADALLLHLGGSALAAVRYRGANPGAVCGGSGDVRPFRPLYLRRLLAVPHGRLPRAPAPVRARSEVDGAKRREERAAPPGLAPGPYSTTSLRVALPPGPSA
ncbi:cation diffusion facilitator family transporter [Hymenobacter humi]